MGLNVIKILIAVILVVVTVNLYFLSVILTQETDSSGKTANKIIKQELKYKSNIKRFDEKKALKNNDFEQSVEINTTLVATKKILATVKNIKYFYKSLSGYKSTRTQFKTILNDFTKSIPISVSSESLWNTARKWVDRRGLLPLRGSHMLSNILDTLSTVKIFKADNISKGTQLKIMLTLEGGQKALFKPQWYFRDEIITGPVFAGRDRHNGEVAAFYLSAILNMRRAPITVGRKVHLKQELLPVATSSLLDTFYEEDTKTCFYGICYYCQPKKGVCSDDSGMLEGAVILWLPSHLQLKKYRHPWQRSYRTGVIARWELDNEYCKKVRKISMYSHGPRLLDLIDTAMFDFLIDNGDRHHYEVFSSDNYSTVLLLDNGKSFGNPHEDHIDILAPLYQCCRYNTTVYMVSIMES
ncbi:glycosaminoglycan xylosylkinase isoform X2 [Lycorma delicatula]|uniref:glycosaminoglycan xylosylkinase isoform X2 n=1 Tax=Lycorma delicatula TaxID=130591 RepID=UPI003F511090